MKTIARLTVIKISHDDAGENTKCKSQRDNITIQQKYAHLVTLVILWHDC